MNFPQWAFGLFLKDQKPLLTPDPSLSFYCPVSKKKVFWEASNIYNPAPLEKDGKIHLFYRADDTAKPFLDTYGNPMVTCRIGHAVSEDGEHFAKAPAPVLYPDNDAYQEYEWDGGCQDLHIVQAENGRYYMNYTAWTGSNDHTNDPGLPNSKYQDVLMVASSEDLVHWTKHGPAFSEEDGRNHTRSGVIVSAVKDGKLVAVKIRGHYVMYCSHRGEMAYSDDLIHWHFCKDENGRRLSLFPTLPAHAYANASCEAGAAAILTEHGIVYFFNAAEQSDNISLLWTQGQALISKDDLLTVLDVLPEPHLRPEFGWECTGHVPTPCIVCNGILLHDGQWIMYYGASDHVIGRAVYKCDAQR